MLHTEILISKKKIDQSSLRLLDKEKHVKHGTWKRHMGTLVPLFLSRLGEGLVTLRAGKGIISCMNLLMSLQNTRHGERLVTQ